MKNSKLLVLLATVAMLTACNPGDPTSQGSDNSDTNTSQVAKESYKITLSSDVKGVTLKSDKEKASEGEKVTITVTINDPAYKVTSVVAGTTNCTKVNDTTYTFIMPDNPVTVKCNIVVNGDVTLQGDIAAPFKKEGDIYTARNVKVAKDSKFDVLITTKEGVHKLSTTEIDRFKTFANVDSVTSSKENHRAFEISGRATYDFFYDPANGTRPLYIKRVSVDELPSNANGVAELFDGTIGSETSVLPDNVVSMTYENALLKEKISWNAYKDNSSLAKVTEKQINGKYREKAVIYASYKDDVLEVIDNYVPGNNENNVNGNFATDTSVYSGQYKVLSSDNPNVADHDNDFVHYDSYINSRVAEFMVNSAPVDMDTFNFDIRLGYRDGYVIEDETTLAIANISSVQDGENFITTIKSSVTHDGSKAVHGDSKLVEHLEHRTTLKFTKAGALLEGDYEYKSFGSDLYDFGKNAFISGDNDSNYEKGKLENKVTISYTYGEKVDNDSAFDKSPYFVSKINKAVINNEYAIGKEENKLNFGDNAATYFIAEDMDVEPKTALNKYQYKIIKSADDKVVSEVDGKFIAGSKVGQTNLTVGLLNGLGVTKDVKVNVVDGQSVRSFFMNEHWQKWDPITSSDTANVFTGQVSEFGLDTKSGKNKTMLMPADTTATILDNNYGFSVRLNHENQTIIVDGSKAVYSKSASFVVELQTASYDKSWTDGEPVHLTFTILEGSAKDAMIGTWTSNATDGSITFTKEACNESVENKTKYALKGIIKSKEGTFEFAYSFDNHRNKIECILVNGGLNDLTLIYHVETKVIDARFVLRDWTTEEGKKTTDVFGYGEGDNVIYDPFVKEAK